MGGTRLPCVLEDLSAQGARLRAGGAASEGQGARIDMPNGGFVLGLCTWARGGVAGIAFRPGLTALRFFVNYALGPSRASHVSIAYAPFL